MSELNASQKIRRVGFSSCFFHADPKRPIFKGKTLLYLEESLCHWVQSQNVMTYMIPSVEGASGITLKDYAKDLDALVLQGGSDVSPESYGQKALRPEWNGDLVRDRYEIALFQEFLAQGKPILGICRGAQLINVALGGTLTQDIPTQLDTETNHRNWDIYDQNFHSIEVESGSLLADLDPQKKEHLVNSIHHQSLEKLGKDLKIEARSVKDGLIEAVSYTGKSFVYAVQWHPEFHDQKNPQLMDSIPLLKKFLSIV